MLLVASLSLEVVLLVIRATIHVQVVSPRANAVLNSAARSGLGLLRLPVFLATSGIESHSLQGGSAAHPTAVVSGFRFVLHSNYGVNVLRQLCARAVVCRYVM